VLDRGFACLVDWPLQGGLASIDIEFSFALLCAAVMGSRNLIRENILYIQKYINANINIWQTSFREIKFNGTYLFS